MSGNVYSFTRIGTIEDEQAATRQDIVRSLHDALNGAITGAKNIPVFVREAFEAKVWQQARVFSGGTRQPPISFHDFVHQPYPVGLGQTYDTVRQFLVVDAATLAMFDEASQRPAGNPTGVNQHGRGTVDNINNSSAPERPAGTSAQYAVRRLRKATEAGDTQASELLTQVAAGAISPNAAAIAMGWRPKMVSLPDDTDAMLTALVKRVGTLAVAQRLLARVTTEEREAILLMVAAWSPPAGTSEGLI